MLTRPHLATKPRDQVIRMLQHVQQTGHTLYTFIVPMDPASGPAVLELTATNYIQRMRVELSRMRKRVRQRHQQLKDFSVLRRDIRPCADGVQITLEYRESGLGEIQDALSDAFGLISTGRPALDHKKARGLPQEPAAIRVPVGSIKLGGKVNAES